MANQQKMLHMGLRWFRDEKRPLNEKVFWAVGVVYLYADKKRGIKPDMERFYGLEDIQPAVKRLLKRNSIKLLDEKPKFVNLG